MFDIGFTEILLISVVALLVLGPDKLPGTIRTCGLWIGRLKRSFNNIKTEIEKEVGADEIRRQLRNEAIMEKIKSTKGQFTETIQSVKDEAKAATDSLKPEGLDELGKEFKAMTGQSKPDDSGPNNTPDNKPEPTQSNTAKTEESAPVESNDSNKNTSSNEDSEKS